MAILVVIGDMPTVLNIFLGNQKPLDQFLIIVVLLALDDDM